MLNFKYDFEFAEVVIDGSLFGVAYFQDFHNFHVNWIFTIHSLVVF